MAEESGYANDDNRRAERGLMGSLGTPGDQPRKLLENAREMSLDPGNVSDPGKRAASLLETNPEIPWKTGRPRQTTKMGFIMSIIMGTHGDKPRKIPRPSHLASGRADYVKGF